MCSCRICFGIAFVSAVLQGLVAFSACWARECRVLTTARHFQSGRGRRRHVRQRGTKAGGGAGASGTCSDGPAGWASSSFPREGTAPEALKPNRTTRMAPVPSWGPPPRDLISPKPLPHGGSIHKWSTWEFGVESPTCGLLGHVETPATGRRCKGRCHPMRNPFRSSDS